MSRIAAVQSVNSMLEAKINSVGSPKAMFQAILEEKLGVVSSTTGTSTSSASSATSANADYLELMNSYYGTSGTGSTNGLSGWDQLVYGSYVNQLLSQYDTSDNPSSTTAYDGYIKKASQEYGVPEALIKAVIACESSFNPNAVSKSGAVGLMQLMPSTAKGLGVSNSYDPEQNIMGGTKYLSSLLDNFDGDLILALSGYNMGGTKVKNLGITPNSSSESAYDSIPDGVMSYAKKVISKMAEY